MLERANSKSGALHRQLPATLKRGGGLEASQTPMGTGIIIPRLCVSSDNQDRNFRYKMELIARESGQQLGDLLFCFS